ncbi:MAG: two-component histidine kinase [Gemmatimonadetes bacterium]|nr:two-component histidine kinase [Gemmatimonadota bacterium]
MKALRRGTPELVVALLLALLLTSYVWYTQRAVRELRHQAGISSRMYARIFRAQSDTSISASTLALSDLAGAIVEQGVPVIVTDRLGRPTAHANLPAAIADDDERIVAYVKVLDARNPPVTDSLVGQIHFGDTPLVNGLRVIPVLQAVTAAILLIFGLSIIRARGNASRERIWAGMARESAHQLGTPLSSLAGWIELLEERGESDERIGAAVRHMRGDLDRLDRVAHRFERIGREPRAESIDVTAIVDRVVGYFRARVPQLANAVVVEAHHGDEVIHVEGDAVLFEWVLEVLVKNAVDALAGRGGHVDVHVKGVPEGGARVRVADDGPGVPPDLRRRIFEPGFSTKKGGWGIGLALARRIVEDNHGGTLALVNADRGATFEIILR